jgi:hypothetical protein
MKERKILYYQILKEDNCWNMSETVREAIKYGWEPQGGISCSSVSCVGGMIESCLQAIVKYESDDPCEGAI